MPIQRRESCSAVQRIWSLVRVDGGREQRYSRECCPSLSR